MHITSFMELNMLLINEIFHKCVQFDSISNVPELKFHYITVFATCCHPEIQKLLTPVVEWLYQ